MPHHREPEEMVHITARVPIALARAFERLAMSEERSVSAELRRAMRSHVERMRERVEGDEGLSPAA